MKFFELNFATMLIRYYLMMAIIIIGGFTGQWWLAIVGFLFFLGAIMGVSFKKEMKKDKEASGKIITMNAGNELKKAM